MKNKNANDAHRKIDEIMNRPFRSKLEIAQIQRSILKHFGSKNFETMIKTKSIIGRYNQ